MPRRSHPPVPTCRAPTCRAPTPGSAPWDSSTVPSAPRSTEPVENPAPPAIDDTTTDDAQPDAIDALRAGNDGRRRTRAQLTPDRAAELWRLHEVTLEAERQTRHGFGKRAARRRLQDAMTIEAHSLHALGFATFDEFAEVHTSSPADEVQDEANASETAETIARIAEMLDEIGIDAGDDPLEAARLFLASHEGAVAAAAGAPRSKPRPVSSSSRTPAA